MKNKNYLVSTTVACLCTDRHAAPIRRNKNLIRFLQSFVLLPVIAVSVPIGGIVGAMKADTTPVPKAEMVLTVPKQENVVGEGLLAFNQVIDQKAKEKEETLKNQAEAINVYFKNRNMPLHGTGMKMAEEADKNGVDWRLLPAIAVRESTGGKHACKKVENSFFGWGGCNISFKSKEEAIETVARNLGGNNPNTDHYYNKDKTTKQLLETYNPRHIVAYYPEQVIAIMDAIGKEDMAPAPLVTQK